MFDSLNEPISSRTATGLSKLSVVLRSQGWVTAATLGLTPTQAQILRLLATEDVAEHRPARLAARLQVSRPTVSDAVSALERKGLVSREADASDRRGAVLGLTGTGRAAADQTADWPAFLASAIASLPEADQVGLLRGLVGTIRALQLRGEIPVARLCVTCRFFQPNIHPGSPTPHHCGFVDAPFGDRHLRLDCPEQDPAPESEQASLWVRFNQTSTERISP